MTDDIGRSPSPATAGEGRGDGNAPSLRPGSPRPPAAVAAGPCLSRKAGEGFRQRRPVPFSIVARRLALLWLCAAMLWAAPAPAGESPDLRPDAALASSQAAIGRALADHVFTDTLNRKVRLAELRGKPLVLSLVYTGCADICPMVSEALVDAVDVARDLVGEQAFTVATIGFDARNDTPQRMLAFARSHGLERPNWRFLSGDSETIDRLAAELGFLFYASPRGFDHLAQTTVIDADGKVAGQVYGATFEPPQLVEPLKALALGQNRPFGSWSGMIEEVRLICSFYDPSTGRYRFDYSVLLSIALGGLSLAAVGAFLVNAILQRRSMSESSPAPRPSTAEGPRVR